jgi:multiple sugar transport system substrate-binding protein
MEEIVFSIGNHGAAGLENLKKLVDLFERQYGIHVRLDVIPNSHQRWSGLVEAALYHNGPDVSEVGDSWVGDLIRMEALRPFQPGEVDEITSGVPYFEAVWKSSIREYEGRPSVFSIPWSTDSRVVFYRPDLLRENGIDEKSAFDSFTNLAATLSTLANTNHPMPLALPSRRSNLTLHCIASWVWAAGGDFLNPQGTNIGFDQPQALEGCKAYYRLRRFLSSEAQNMEENESDDAFDLGKAAVLLSGFWIPTNNLSPVVRANLGAVPIPGIPFVGGSHLAIWAHSRHEQAAQKLIKFFHSEEAAQYLYPWFGLPISENGWQRPPFNSDIYQTFRTAIQRGRSFPTVELWGLVEKRLTDILADIWNEILKKADSDTDAIVESHLIGLARRLQLTLEL